MTAPVLKLIQGTESGRLYHWCPACLTLHPLPSDTGKWTFDGNFEKPTFSPSFKHSGMQTVTDVQGRWTGEWVLDANGNGVPFICHYILTAGVLNFCGDCTHAMAGQSVPLPPVPEGAE